MSNENRFTQKIDTLDMIINILREQEEKLDQLTERIEIVADRLEKVVQKT